MGNKPVIVCPFFHFMGRRSISCEGITDYCFNKIVFNSDGLKQEHQAMFCEKKYKNCEIYRMLEAKYEE